MTQKPSLNCLEQYLGLVLVCWIAGSLFVPACLGCSNFQTASINPQALVRQVVENELQARLRQPILWRYILRTQAGEGSRTESVVETGKGIVKRLLAQNGRPLSPKQRRQEDERIEELIRNPRDLAEQEHKEKDDLQKAQSLFKMLPDALLYAVDFSNGQTIRLSFKPNPDFNPPTFESRIFRVLQGSILVDSGQKRLIELRAVMSRDLEFVWGIFGKLRKGGSLELRQEQVEPGCWVMTFFNVQVTGRAWFFKSIGKQSHETFEAFMRVSDNLTLVEAADLAKRQAEVDDF
jgi:hypothetical protein